MEGIPLHILYFNGKDQSPSKFVRVLQPLSYLKNEGHTITAIESLPKMEDGSISWPVLEEALKKCDLFVISNVDILPEFFPVFERMADYCNKNRKVLVYDFDDFYDKIPETNPFRKTTLSWEYLQKVIKWAHVLTVTGKELQNALSPYHPRILIFPNMVDCKTFLPRPNRGGKLRIGWAGGVTHLPDLPIIADAIRNLQKKYHFEFIIFGMFSQLYEIATNVKTVRKFSIDPKEVEDPFHQTFVDFARHMDGIRYRAEPGVPYPEFPKTLSELDLDLGLCPIQDTLFNRCRSAVKFCQYAAVNTPSIASNIYPYTEEPVMLTDNTTEAWTATMEAMIADKELREKTARMQYEYVLQNRNYSVNGTLWETTYQQLVHRSWK